MFSEFDRHSKYPVGRVPDYPKTRISASVPATALLQYCISEPGLRLSERYAMVSGVILELYWITSTAILFQICGPLLFTIFNSAHPLLNDSLSEYSILHCSNLIKQASTYFGLILQLHGLPTRTGSLFGKPSGSPAAPWCHAQFCRSIFTVVALYGHDIDHAYSDHPVGSHADVHEVRYQ